MRCSGDHSSPKVWAKLPSSLLNGSPKKLGRGTPVMPSGPWVRLCQLISISRMISPKASVTMAR